jgi:tetratricopeptide (TPR) repeat protein
MRNGYLFTTLLLSLMVWACSPKTAPEPEVIEEVEIPVPIKQEPENPCATFKDLSGTQRDEVETAYVLYKDLVKQQKYKEAFPYWEKAYYGAPGSNGRVTYQFDDGVVIYTNLYQNESEEAKKAIYVDSVMSIYHKRMECFGDEAYIQGRIAFDAYYTFPGIMSDQEVYDKFKMNFDVNGKKADYFVVNPFTKILADRIIANEISYEEGRKYAKLIGKTVEYGLKTCKGVLCDSWDIINDYAPARLESLEGIDGFYDCDYYADKYYERFENDSTNCDVINLVGRRLKRGGCSESDPRLLAVTNAYREHCYEAPELGDVGKGNEAYRNGQYKEAIQHYTNYISKISDANEKAKFDYRIAQVYYGDLKDFPKARTHALAAAGHKNNWGEPFMLIGKLYASSGPLCGSGRGWNSQVVTWAAIDKFEYAKKIDPSVAQEANKWINQYSKYMPNKEDIFQRRIKAGDTFRVPCWIQENTVVRTSD